MGKVIAAIDLGRRLHCWAAGRAGARPRHWGRASPLLGDGWPVDVRRRRPRHRRHARRGPGVLRVAHRGAGVRDRRPRQRDAAGAWAAPTRSRTLIVLTHRTEDQPDPGTGFLFIDGFDTALLKARLAGDGRGLLGGDRPGSARALRHVVDELAISTAYSCWVAGSGCSRDSSRTSTSRYLAPGARSTPPRGYAVKRAGQESAMQ